MKSSKLFAGLMSAAMLVSVAGCGGDSSNGDSGTTANSTSSSTSTGGDLIVGTTQELAGIFSPLFYTTAYDGWAVDLIYQSMLAYNGNNELLPELAEAMPEVSEDGKTYTFKLKEGIKFSDGTDLNANDVKFTFTLMADPDYIGKRNDGTFNFIEGWSEYQYGDATEVSGIKVIDDYTISFTAETPDISALTTIGGFGIVSDEQFPYEKGSLGQYESDTSDPMGSGPYKLNSYDKSVGASFVKNEEFTGEGEYKINRVVIKTIANATELASLQNGDINYLCETIESTIVGPASLDSSLAMDHYPRAAEGYMGFNCADGPTADPAVRQALAYATDRQGFVDAFYAYPEVSDSMKDVPLGYVPTVFWSPVAADLGQYTRGESELEGLNEYPFDVEKGKQVLEDAGWTVGSDGIREKDGQKLTIKFLASEGNSVLAMLMPMIIASWGDLGVDLKQTTIDFNTLISTVEPANEDVSGWSAYFMATSFTGLENTTMNDLLGYDIDKDTGKVIYRGSNYPRIQDEELNKLLNAGKQTADAAESEDNYKKAMIRESELVPYLPMYGNQLVNIYSNKVHDVKTGPVCNWASALADAYVD